MTKQTLFLLILTGLALSACTATGSTPPAEPAASPGSSNQTVVIEGTRPAVVDDLVLPESDPYEEYQMVTLLPQDAIEAIFDPTFLTSEEADNFYDWDELVIGVEIDGEARAYSVPYLSSHEIVNDQIGDTKFAVTW